MAIYGTNRISGINNHYLNYEGGVNQIPIEIPAGVGMANIPIGIAPTAMPENFADAHTDYDESKKEGSGNIIAAGITTALVAGGAGLLAYKAHSKKSFAEIFEHLKNVITKFIKNGGDKVVKEGEKEAEQATGKRIKTNGTGQTVKASTTKKATRPKAKIKKKIEDPRVDSLLQEYSSLYTDQRGHGIENFRKFEYRLQKIKEELRKLGVTDIVTKVNPKSGEYVTSIKA